MPCASPSSTLDIPFLARALIIRSPIVPVEVWQEGADYTLKGVGVLALGTEVCAAAGPEGIAALKTERGVAERPGLSDE